MTTPESHAELLQRASAAIDSAIASAAPMALGGIRRTIHPTRMQAIRDAHDALVERCRVADQEIVRLMGGVQETMSDHKRKSLFAGDAIDYVRHRAQKHEADYSDKKQASHLRRLATEYESARTQAEAKLAEVTRVLEAIVERSNNGTLGTSKVNDMRALALAALSPAAAAGEAK